MAEALKTFREGEDILASETNENNQFLLSKLSDNAAQVQSYVEGEVATIKSNVASVQATLQNNIDDINKRIKVYIIDTFVEGATGYVIWSNGYCEQWGRFYQTGTGTTTQTIQFLKKFIDTNYSFSTSADARDFTLTTTSLRAQYAWGIGGTSYGTIFWKVSGFLAKDQY